MRIGITKLACMAALVLIGISNVGAATNWYVSAAGSDTNNGTQAQPWRSLTNALVWASTNDTILMTGGLYTNAATIIFSSTNGSLTIQGGCDPADWSWKPATQKTVIRNTATTTVLQFPVLRVTNTLRSVTVTGATASGTKSGIYLSNTNTLILDGCTITNNYYGIGTAVNLPVQLDLRNTLIARNLSYGINHVNYPGGGYCRFQNCTIADNGSDGFHSHPSGANLAPFATNTLFTGNGGYGIYNDGINPTGSVDYCLFYGNKAGAWGTVALQDGGHNKFGPDPRYVNPAAGNYQLQLNSPAAAAGRDQTATGVTNDLLGVQRPGANGWDMGAYQGSGTGAPPSLAIGYVSTAGHDDTGNGSSNNPWASIAYGAAGVAPTGTVCVAGGSYTGNVSLGVGTVTIRGGYDPVRWVWDPAHQRTALNGNTNAPVSIVSPNCTNAIQSMVLYGGTGGAQAGVFVNSMNANCRLIVDGCTITGNTYGVLGGNGTIPAPIQILLRNTLVALNSSYGIYERYTAGGSCQMLNCTIADNGLAGYYDHVNGDANMAPVATNCLFTGNGGYGIYIDGSSNTGSVDYCLFYGNASGAWRTNNPPAIGVNNTTNADPLYVNAPAGNYQITAASPAFNTGRNLLTAGVTVDILGVVRPQGGAFDRGAYERPVIPAGATIMVR